MSDYDDRKSKDWEYWLVQWLAAYRIDVIPENDRWRTVAYDAKGVVLEYSIGKTRRDAIESLCVEMSIISFWRIHEQPASPAGLLDELT